MGYNGSLDRFPLDHGADDYEYCQSCGEFLELGGEPFEGLICPNDDCEVNQ
jgi:hypothetical protein